MRKDQLNLKKELLSENDKFLVADILPDIKLLLSTMALKDVVLDLEECLKHNYVPGLLVIAGGIMSFHYRPVVSMFGGCSLLVATGPPATGKTSSVNGFLALRGSYKNNMYVTGTNRAFRERASLSSLPFGMDNPSDKRKGKSKANNLDIAELAIDLYNGSPTTNYQTGTLYPLSLDHEQDER